MARDKTSSGDADRRIPKGGYLSREEVAAITPEELTRRIRSLVPLIEANAAEAERLRRPVDAVWQALRDSGFFYQFVPKVYGGIETDFDSFIDASLAIAEADPSTSWVATFCAEHNWLLSHFPKATLDAIWGGDHPYIIAPYSASPPGKAIPVDGGYRVTGRWSWGTGIMHADWVMLNSLIPQAEGPPQQAMVLLRAEEVRVPDTWQMFGMAGTGSNDIVVEDVFVPTDRAVVNLARSGRQPNERAFENPIYGVPMLPFLAMSAAIPALGATRGMLKAYQNRLEHHLRGGSNTVQAEKVAPHIRLGRADLLARSAEALIRDAGRNLIEVAKLEEPEQTPARIAVRGQLALAVAQCRDAALLLAEGAGSGALSLDNPFQRNFRDLFAMSTHIVFDVDIAFELHGRALLGLPPNALAH